jgi:CubicO group peptidase (beta-lactamase class C family)
MIGCGMADQHAVTVCAARRQRASGPATCLLASLSALVIASTTAHAVRPVTPGTHWAVRSPAELGLSLAKLDALRDLVGGEGCVIRHGYLAYQWGDVARSHDVASAVKPVISTLLLLAVQERRLKSVDDPVAAVEPRLRTINGGKDAAITWRHLASQTSGYGLAEAPGAAYSYNDFALALYYDTLMEKVYRTPGTDVLRTRLGEPLGFEDSYTFNAFRRDDRAGRLAISVRDFARFGLLVLNHGRWRGQQIVKADLLGMSLNSPIPADLPRTSGREADMLPGQRTLGGSRNQGPVGPGFYSFNWWLNRTDREGRRLFVAAPPDTFVAAGHGGIRMLWVIPSLDMIVCWNETSVEDHDASPGNPNTKANQAARLIREAAEGSARVQTVLAISGTRWMMNGRVMYPGAKAEGLLMNVRMVNAVFEDRKRPHYRAEADANTSSFIARIPEYAACGVRVFTICLQGGTPGYEGVVNSAFKPDGSLDAVYMKRVQSVIDACDRQGVAIVLTCFYQRQDQRLRDEAAVRAGVVNVCRWIVEHGWRNILLEIANERGHGGFDHPLLRTAAGETELIHLARKTAPTLLMAANEGTEAVGDVIIVHFNNTPLATIPARIAALRAYGKPVVCNEDQKVGAEGAEAASRCVEAGASWGLMEERVNQHYPFRFAGPTDDPIVYARLKELTTAR